VPLIRLGDVELYYEEYGGGGTVVVSAQMAFTEGRYPSRLAGPPTGYHVYCLQLRGYGRSTHVFEDLGERWYPTWAEDVHRFARALGLPRFVYTGISHGAGVGWYLALAHPEDLLGFVSVVGGPHDRSGGDTSAARRAQIEAGRDPEKLRQILQRGLPPDAEGDPDTKQRREALLQRRINRFLAMSDEELRINPRKPFPEARTDAELARLLSRVEVPTLLVAGMRDHIISPEASLRAATSVPGAVAVFFQDASHWVAEEHEEAVIAHVKVFVDRLVVG